MMSQDDSSRLNWVAAIFPCLAIGLAVTSYVIGLRYFVSDEPLRQAFAADTRLPCEGATESCLEASLVENGVLECPDGERHVCIKPLGNVDPRLLNDLVDYFDDEYGLEISVMYSSSVGSYLVNASRQQIDGADLIEIVELNREVSPSSVIIGLTPIDLYTRDRDWYFELGERGDYNDPVGVISTFRMNIVADYDLVLRRAEKMLERYIGQLYYGFELSDDDRSPLRSSILSVDDLDEIEDPLPVEY